MRSYWLAGSLAASRMLAVLLCGTATVAEHEYRRILYRAYWYIRDERKADNL